MKKITFLVISLMTSASAYGQTTPTTNSIYIDQVGDGSTITLTQEGQTNTIGEGEAEADRFVLQGNGQTVTVKQDGSSNAIIGSVEQADDIDYNTTVTGDSNTIKYNQGDLGSVAGSEKTLTVAGNNNTLTFNQGTTVEADPDVVVAAVTSTDSAGVITIITPAYISSPGASGSTGASAANAKQEISITGDGNTYTSTINTSNVKNDVVVGGNTNVIKIVQDGNAGNSNSGKSVEMDLLGDSNKISVNQKSTGNVDTIKINSDSSNSILVINQCSNSGPC